MKNAESLKGLSNRQKQGRTRIKTEDTLILDNPEWTIVIPHTHRAAIHWSKDASGIQLCKMMIHGLISLMERAISISSGINPRMKAINSILKRNHSLMI